MAGRIEPGRMRSRRRGALVAVVALIVALVPAVTPVRASLGCPTTIDASTFTTAAQLRAGNKVEADLGARPTASPAHTQFVDWVDARLHEIPGLHISDLPIEIDRQLETGAALTVGSVDLPVAGAVPYAAPITATAPLVRVSATTALADANIRGRIVVREALPGNVAFLAFAAVAYLIYDPALTLRYFGKYERDWMGAAQRIIDLQQAQAGGAAGLIFVSSLPRQQLAGSYYPYPGTFWKVPAVYLGADEGAQLDRLMGGVATLSVAAERALATTRTIVASLPGQSAERIVIESHTDGMNAVWDNGPIALLALARSFAALPLRCRPRTIEFVFTTAHLYLSKLGAEQYAAMLDRDYSKGAVDFVVALEHLGAREFVPVPRTDGPGQKLVPSGKSEMLAVFSMESPLLVTALLARVVARDLRRTVVLRGADAPAVALPPHRSFGGEGGPYREHLVPTIAAITGPQTLFDPSFGMDELVDFDLMRRQTMAFGDVILAVDDAPRVLIAGADTVYRAARSITYSCPLPGLGAVGA